MSPCPPRPSVLRIVTDPCTRFNSLLWLRMYRCERCIPFACSLHVLPGLPVVLSNQIVEASALLLHNGKRMPLVELWKLHMEREWEVDVFLTHLRAVMRGYRMLV